MTLANNQIKSLLADTVNKSPLAGTANKFERCMVFAGGGFRFGAYLGMYAAACDAGKKPDILLASCGGAIAAALIHALPDHSARKAWLCSPQMYDYSRSARSTPHAALHRVLLRAAQRRFSKHLAATIPDLYSEYMFEPPNSAIPLPLVASYPEQPALAIIGAKILFSLSDVGHARGTRKLVAETVFAEARVHDLLADKTVAMAHGEWRASTIAPHYCFESVYPLANTVLISTSDVVYFPLVSHLGQHYSGGAIDLFPIEVAKQLATETIMEWKAPLDQNFAAPAWRAAYGIDGNARLAQVQQNISSDGADAWIDTRDIRQKLRHTQVQKKFDWRTGRITLVAPKTYADFVAQMQAQWQYGYECGAAAFAKQRVNS